VQGVGPGTVLGGRYALRRRLAQGSEVEFWSGHDATLEREVALTIIGAAHPNRAGVLDAARRAAGVEDTRLVRILDVGTESDNSFIVEETMSGSESLATILQQGPLPSEEARRIAGETAKGLETAGQRGLHHLRLTPHHILIAPDGELRVSGVAVAAAIDGPSELEPDAVTALRQDAISLAAITYAALTSRWPLEEKVAGVEPAPRVVNGVVAPAEIVAGVPGDLDALCRNMLNDGAGPLTPGVFANRIAPWSRQRVHRGESVPAMASPVPEVGVTPADIPARKAAPRTSPARKGPARGIPAGAMETEPTVAIPTQHARPDNTTGKAAHPASEPTVAIPTQHARPDSTTGKAAAPASEPAPAIQTGQPPPGGPSGGSADPGTEPDDVEAVAMPTVGDKAAAATAATTKVLATAFSSASSAAGVVGGKLSAFARSASHKTVRPPSVEHDTKHSTEHMSLPPGLLSQVGDEGPPLPLLPASTALPPGRGQSKIVVLVVAAFVGLSLVVATCGLRAPDKGASLSKPTPRRTVTVSAPAVTVVATPKSKSAPSAAAVVAILSATGFDPEGDRKERNSQAAKVYDGDLATSWTSEGYGTVDFGNLKKGVGVVLDLGQPTAVRQVTIDLGSGPVDLTVYAGPDPSLDGATVIGTAKGASGRIQLKPETTKPPGQYLIVWFTSLAPDKDQFRASISEIALN
jgi:eukaryotic-like serine/threonine-protein kinase